MTRRSDEPHPPFTNVELEIGEYAGKGYGHVRIAVLMHRSKRTIEKSVERMAGKLENPDALTPLPLIQLWFAHRRWLRERDQQPPRAA